jgi:hypothetical protein
MLQNRLDAALKRRAKLASDIAALEEGTLRSDQVWVGETASDARENRLAISRQVLATEDQQIAVMQEDLTRWR